MFSGYLSKELLSFPNRSTTVSVSFTGTLSRTISGTISNGAVNRTARSLWFDAQVSTTENPADTLRGIGIYHQEDQNNYDFRKLVQTQDWCPSCNSSCLHPALLSIIFLGFSPCIGFCICIRISFNLPNNFSYPENVSYEDIIRRSIEIP